MKISLYTIAALMMLAIDAQPALAQLPVTDGAAVTELTAINAFEASIDAELSTANGQLVNVNRAVTSSDVTLKALEVMLTKPTPIAGQFAGIDGGATPNTAEQVRDYLVSLRGETSASPSAGLLLAQERGEMMADEAKGFLTGNSAAEVAERQRLIGVNFQGQAFDDMRVYGTRYTSAETMEARLSAIPDIKSATVFQAGLTLQVLRALDLLGQSISLNTAAVAEAQFYMLKEFFRIRDDHERTAAAVAI